MNAREEWLDWRRQGVGASDVAGIIGLSPWSSPVAVWLEKTMRHEVEVTEAMQWGSTLEDVILDEWERRTGDVASFRQFMAQRIDQPHHLATIDGRSQQTGDVLEVKNVGSWPYRDEIPLHYSIQIQWQLHVLEAERGHLIALHTGNKLETYPVERDQKAIDQLVQAVDHFWQTYVVADQMPPADDSDATHRALRDQFSNATERSVELGSDALAAVRKRTELKAQTKELEQQIKHCESIIFQALGDADTGTIDGLNIVSWKQIDVAPSVRDGYSFRRLNISKSKLEDLS